MGRGVPAAFRHSSQISSRTPGCTFWATRFKHRRHPSIAPPQASDALEHRRGPYRAEPFLYSVKGVLSTFAGELAFVAVVDAQHCAAVIDDNQPTSAGLKYGVHFMNCCGILPAYLNLCSI